MARLLLKIMMRAGGRGRPARSNTPERVGWELVACVPSANNENDSDNNDISVPNVDAMTEEKYDAWFRNEVELGLAEANHGALIPHEQVVREMREHIERRRRERAARNALSSGNDQIGD